MRRTIRQSVFETNSSSVHAIVIDTHMPEAPDYAEYHSNGGEFGWERDELSWPKARLDYLWQGIVSCYADEEGAIDEWAYAIHEWMPNAVLEIPDESDCHYIDHAYEGKYVWDKMREDHLMLGRYLLSPNSCVHTWNDNDPDYKWDEPWYDLPSDGEYELYEK